MQDSKESIEPIKCAPMSQALIRRERLQLWMKQHNLDVGKVARAYGCKPAYIRSILHISEIRRDIGEKSRDKLESTLNMPSGFLDGDASPRIAAAHPLNQLRQIGDIVSVPLLTRSKQVNKLDLTQTTQLPTALLEYSGTKPEDAAWLRVESTDMLPTLVKGCVALVNTAEKTPLDGKVFVLGWGESLIIRRIHHVPTGLRLSVDANPSANITMTTADFRSQVSVAGRIRSAFSALE